MTHVLACIGGEEIYRQWDSGQVSGDALGSRATPFGDSGDLFRIDADAGPFYLLARYAGGMDRPSPYGVNYRANIYALKDLGVDCIVGYGPGGAITHSIAVGDMVILNDLIDQTTLRPRTFFEDSPLGFLRQLPVFCTVLREQLADVLAEMKLVYHPAGTIAVREGPRMETPAEVRMLAHLDAEILTHTFVPEMFLAKELQMAYAAICYITSYAETGSQYKPFAGAGLFSGQNLESETDRLAGAVGALGKIASHLARRLSDADMNQCTCFGTQAGHIQEYNLPEDWREWFEHR